MVDQTKDIVSFPGEASDSGENISKGAGNGNDGQNDSTANGEKFLTEDSFNQKMSEFEKKFQSRSDKATASALKPLRVQIQEINNSYQQMLDSGVDLTDEQKAKLNTQRVDAIAKAAESDDQTDSPDKQQIQEPMPKADGSNDGKPDQSASPQVSAIKAAATEIMDDVGARIYPDDPEAELLKSSRDKAEYLSNAKIAAERKLARLGRDPMSMGTGSRTPQDNALDYKTPSALWDEVKKTL